MIKKDLINIYIDLIHSIPPKKNQETNKIDIILLMKCGVLIWMT